MSRNAGSRLISLRPPSASSAKPSPCPGSKPVLEVAWHFPSCVLATYSRTARCFTRDWKFKKKHNHNPMLHYPLLEKNSEPQEGAAEGPSLEGAQATGWGFHPIRRGQGRQEDGEAIGGSGQGESKGGRGRAPGTTPSTDTAAPARSRKQSQKKTEPRWCRRCQPGPQAWSWQSPPFRRRLEGRGPGRDGGEVSALTIPASRITHVVEPALSPAPAFLSLSFGDATPVPCILTVSFIFCILMI